MRVISIDTLIMKQLASAAASSNESVNDAVEALNRIAIHNDWGCKEKDAINDYSVANKNKIKQLQEHSRAFLNSVSQAADDFDKSENDVIGWGSGIDSIIGACIGVIGTGTTHTGGNNRPSIFPDMKEILKDILKDDGIGKWGHNTPVGIAAQVLNDIEAPIPICKFDDINL